jgi:hypothetical protein
MAMDPIIAHSTLTLQLTWELTWLITLDYPTPDLAIPETPFLRFFDATSLSSLS